MSICTYTYTYAYTYTHTHTCPHDLRNRDKRERESERERDRERERERERTCVFQAYVLRIHVMAHRSQAGTPDSEQPPPMIGLDLGALQKTTFMGFIGLQEGSVPTKNTSLLKPAYLYLFVEARLLSDPWEKYICSWLNGTITQTRVSTSRANLEFGPSQHARCGF